MFEFLNLLLSNSYYPNFVGLIKYIFINKNILLFLLFVYIGILLDKRFKLKNKIFIFFAFILFILIMFIFKGVNSLLIKDIF